MKHMNNIKTIRNNSPLGFTLIEILVALVIVSVAVLSLGGFTLSMMGSSQVSRERLTAVHLAEQVLEYWQHNTGDYAPVINADCALTEATSLQNYPVTCTPVAGVSIAYTIQAAKAPVTGPLPASSTSFAAFNDPGLNSVYTNNPPKVKAVTVSWSNHGKVHSVYLTHLSKVQ